MSMKRYKPEQIITLLRQIEVEIVNGKTTPASRPSPANGQNANRSSKGARVVLDVVDKKPQK
jgi:hypothetical protein